MRGWRTNNLVVRRALSESSVTESNQQLILCDGIQKQTHYHLQLIQRSSDSSLMAQKIQPNVKFSLFSPNVLHYQEYYRYIKNIQHSTRELNPIIINEAENQQMEIDIGSCESVMSL